MNPKAHLACYPIKAQGFKPRTVLITNQFESLGPMTVVAPATLCVEMGKSLVAGVAPPQVKGSTTTSASRSSRRARSRRIRLR